MPERFDVVVVGGTPGGIMAAIAAARSGASVVLLERTAHLGGLPANGLGTTDIATRGATGGLFLEFVGRVRDYYATTYGETSQQVKDCSNGYHFEPSIAERILNVMVREQSARLQVRLMRQFDAQPQNLGKRDGRGFSTLRMEPCWCALGEAAGVAAALAASSGRAARDLDIADLQQRLLDRGAVLLYYRDASPRHPHFKALQFFALRGGAPAWEAKLDEPATPQDVSRWCEIAGVSQSSGRTRGEVMDALWLQRVARPSRA